MGRGRKLKTFAAEVLTAEVLARAVGELARRDADLARVVEVHGPPPLWAREPGFPTLVRVILEQQVSLASAKAAYERLLASAGGPLTPRSFLALDDAALKAAGFSRQKTAYGRELAGALVAGRLDLDALARLGDEEARNELTKVKGVGRWTADIYLLMALGRPDVWPAGDLALAVAAQRVKRLPARPSTAELESLGESWRPWRAVAARILWHQYLSERVRKTI